MKHEHGLASFFDLWNPVLALLLICIGYLFIRALKKYSTNEEILLLSTNKRIAYMIVGLTLFYIGQGSPLNYYGHHFFFSIHMLQQTIIYLTVPIFAWLAIPESLLRFFVQLKWVRPIFYFLARPLIALFTFNMLISIYHFPIIMDGLMSHQWLHLIYHSILIITSFMMWFPVFGQYPELNRLTELHKIGYIFANGLLLTPACALIIFANTLLYDTYSSVHPPFRWLDPLDDQQLGGVIMKIVQEVVYGIALAMIFFKWYRKERDNDDAEAQ
jgi:putative membrane protein